jgi:TolB protein
VTVVTFTAGPASGASNYAVRVDLARRETMGITDTLVISNITTGKHQVTIQGVAPRCTLAGAMSREVIVEDAESAFVRFAVTCPAGGGTLQIATVTRGADLDPSGYLVLIDDRFRLPVEDTALVSTSLPVGRYEVRLDGIANNCLVRGTHTRTIAVPSEGVARVAYDIDCSATRPAGRGHEIAFARRVPSEFGTIGRVFVMNEDGSSVRILPSLPNNDQGAPEWLPDGMRLGFVAQNQGCDRVCGVLYLFEADGVIGEPLVSSIDIPEINFSPDGQQIAFAVSDHDCDDCFVAVVLAPLDGSKTTFIGGGSIDYDSPDFLPDGSGIVMLRSTEEALEIVTREIGGSVDTPISPNLREQFGFASDLAVSPDGSKLAFTALGQNARHDRIYVMDMNDGLPVALTGEEWDSFQPDWSPDGNHIAFASNRDGNGNIYVMDSDGANQERISSDPGFESHPAWRP